LSDRPESRLPRFRYLRDPLFLGCVALYFVNRLLLKPLAPHGFFRDHLNDLLCLPFWVPIMLWLMRRTGLRADDDPPRWYEIAVPLALWTVMFENWVPQWAPLHGRVVADSRDAVAYLAGAAIAALWWSGPWLGSARIGSGRELRHKAGDLVQQLAGQEPEGTDPPRETVSGAGVEVHAPDGRLDRRGPAGSQAGHDAS
jgi:hypothetical protein